VAGAAAVDGDAGRVAVLVVDVGDSQAVDLAVDVAVVLRVGEVARVAQGHRSLRAVGRIVDDDRVEAGGRLKIERARDAPGAAAAAHFHRASAAPHDVGSFPSRRSSDLVAGAAAVDGDAGRVAVLVIDVGDGQAVNLT